MTDFSKVSRAIQYALVASTIATPAAFAQDSEDKADTVERIEVTGSRIQRTDMESALPVSVITAEDIAATGLNDVAGVIAQLPFNSAGSFQSASGSSASNHSSSGLRGLSSERTLVLVNGRRVAPSATLGGTATNLNLIPIEAVERIDVLRDGASSIYGSDAIGGVMNIILKRDFDGLAIKYNTENTTQGGRGQDGFALTFGSTGEKGRAVVVLEHRKWDALKGGQRPHLEADWNIPRNRSSVFAPEGSWRALTENDDGTLGAQYGNWHAGINCPDTNDGTTGANGQVVTVGDGTRCGYNFWDGKDYLPARKKDSMFGNFGYEISDSLEWTAQTLVLRDVAEVASTSLWTSGWSSGGENGLTLQADNIFNPTNPNSVNYDAAAAAEYTDDDGNLTPVPIRAAHRLVDVADRNSEFKTVVFDINTGLTWENDYGILDFNLGSSRQMVDRTTNYDYFVDKFQEAVNDGLYNPFARAGDATQATLDSFRHTATRRAETKITNVNLDWAAETSFELQGGTIAYAVGTQFQKMEFSDRQDAQSAAGNTFGAFGGDSAGERNYKAVYGELDLPILDNLQVKISSRYDKYSLPDKGQLSSGINVRYEPIDGVVLRGSYGQGFRVPDLDSLLGEPAVSFDTVIDRTNCAANPGNEDYCDGQQYERNSSGNPDLVPEESDQFSIGMAWNITDNIDMTLDYYNITINDEVAFVTAQEVVDLEANGKLADTYDPTRFFVRRDAAGDIELIGTGVANKAEKKTSGVDFSLNIGLDMADQGELTYAFEGSYILNFDEVDNIVDGARDKVGLSNDSSGGGIPEYRFVTSLTYELEEITARLALQYIDGYDGRTADEIQAGVSAEDKNHYGSFTTVDLVLSYNMDKFGRATIGARNLFDRMPDINDDLLYPFYSEDNHSIMGRAIYFTYVNTF